MMLYAARLVFLGALRQSLSSRDHERDGSSLFKVRSSIDRQVLGLISAEADSVYDL